MNNKNVDNFIKSLESYLIDPSQILGIEYDPATEGINIDIAKMIRADEITKARALLKEGKKLKRQKNYEEAIKKFAQAKPLVDQIKNKVDKMPEPETKGSKILSYLTPIFTTLPSERITSFMIIPTGNNSFYINYTTEKFTDKMSENTTSGVKRDLQLKFNLFNNNLDKYIKSCKEAIVYRDNKLKKAALKAEKKANKK